MAIRRAPDGRAFTGAATKLWAIALVFTFLALHSLLAVGFSEPPAILYGRVLHVGQGATYQVFTGQLRVTLVSQSNPLNAVTLSAKLSPSGPNGAFSYRLEIPQQYLPSPEELGSALNVGASDTSFHFANITIEGVAAVPLDSAVSLLQTSFSRRAAEHRLDLKVTLAEVDTDGDGIPDWYENQIGRAHV